MFGHHDVGWWGIAIGFLLFALSFPLSIAANLLTPILKNWWAARSIESLKRRITELTLTRDCMFVLPAMSPIEDELLERTEEEGLMMTIMFLFLMFAAMLAFISLPLVLSIAISTGNLPGIHNPTPEWIHRLGKITDIFASLNVLFGMGMQMSILWLRQKRMRRLREECHSKRELAEIQTEIAKLEEKLDRKEKMKRNEA